MDKYEESITTRKTYDASNHWDEENHPDDIEVFFRCTRSCKPNSRERLLQSLVDFDIFCHDCRRYLREKFKIHLLQDLWNGPWWTVMSGPGTAFQQNNYERVVIPKTEWARIQGALDQNGWERW